MNKIDKNSATSVVFRTILIGFAFFVAGTIFWIMWYAWSPFKEKSPELGFATSGALGALLIGYMERRKTRRLR